MDETWRPLTAALERCTHEGRPARFWLRDDDAVEPTPALDRLLTICERADIPLVLAVIPLATGQSLADRLNDVNSVGVAVHGWAHRNHASAVEKKQELGAHRSPEIVMAELREGLGKLQLLHGSRALPMLVPPWNRIASELVPRLPALGFEALSTFGLPKPAPIHMVNSNVDLIDWHGTRGCVDHAVLVKLVAAQLEGSEPVGILAHHLVHDKAVWAFLEGLFARTRGLGAEWLSGRELLKRPE